MTEQQNKVVLIGGALACAAVLLMVLLPREPSHQGKNLSYWLRQMPTSAARIAIREMGTNALPHLVARLGKKDSRFKVWALGFCNRHKWQIGRLLRPAWKDRGVAAMALQELGEGASAQISEIARLLGDRETSHYALSVLAAIGTNAVPALTNALSIPDPFIRRDIVIAIGGLHANGVAAIPALITCLRDAGLTVRWSAVYALGEIQQQPQITLPALATYLFDPAPALKSTALNAIAQFKETAKPLLLLVLTALQDSAPEVRHSAAKCVKSIERDAVPLFLERLHDFDPNVRESAAFGLQISGDQRAVSALTVLLHDENEAVRRQATNALSAIEVARVKKPYVP